MPRGSASHLIAGADPEGSIAVRPRIAAARALATSGRGVLNARLHGRALRASCGLTSAARHRLIDLADAESSSGRGTERLLRVARTIADLAGRSTVDVDHLEEAAWFRSQGERAIGALAS